MTGESALLQRAWFNRYAGTAREDRVRPHGRMLPAGDMYETALIWLSGPLPGN